MTETKSIGFLRALHGGMGLFALALCIGLYGIGLIIGGTMGALLSIVVVLFSLFVAEGILWQFPKFQIEGNQVVELAQTFWGAMWFMFVHVPMGVLIIYGIL